MSEPHRPEAFARLRKLPLVGRAADWGLGPSAASKHTLHAGTRIAGDDLQVRARLAELDSITGAENYVALPVEEPAAVR